jgi:hypothetical protein
VVTNLTYPGNQSVTLLCDNRNASVETIVHRRELLDKEDRLNGNLTKQKEEKK